jgi:hypothetical protein
VVVDTDDVINVTGAGRDGLPMVRPVFDRRRPGDRSAAGAVVVPEQVVRAWEGTYRQYAQVNEMVTRMTEDDPVGAWHLATVSWAAAKAWREIATVSRLPWWLLAAVESAAEAFEAQARDWEARESGESGGGA